MGEASKAVKLFCSYAHADERWLHKLEIHLSLLKQQGLISLWHDRLIVPGTNWVKVIDTHLETASVILLLVSAEFFASNYCVGIEMKRALERQESGEALVVPILVRQTDWTHAPFAHLHALPTNAKPLATWKDKERALADVAAGIRRVIVEELPRLKASVPRATLPPVWNIPYPRNPFFIGREDLLLHVHTQLQAGQPMALSQHPQAISGLGGIGKTQIAVEYAYRFRMEYQAVLWAQAESREVLISSYVTFATLLNLPEQNTQEHSIIMQAVKRWLQTHREWLLILDNADELTLVQEFLPPVLGGHLLLTTRAQGTGHLANRIEVETFSAEEGTLFLLRRARLLARGTPLEQAVSNDRELAMQITEALGELPLALDQVGAYLEETGCSLAEYQRLYQQHRTDLLRERRGLRADHPAPVATTWSLSFHLVEEKNPAAADLLCLCAFLQPDAIPEEIILEGRQHLGSHIQTLATNPLAFHEAIRTLRSYSLLQRSAEEQMLSMHRLVQVVLQDAMPEHERALWRGRVIQGLSTVFPKVNPTTWRRCERLVPHVLIYAAERAETAESPELATVLERAAGYLREELQYEQAEHLYQRALHIQEQILGLEHPQVASLLAGLATIHTRQKKFKQAEHLYQRALHIQEQAWGSEHFDVTWPLVGLAFIYTKQGKYEQAESLYQRVLRIREQALGTEHLYVASSLDDLGDFYSTQRMYEQVEPLYQRALYIWEQALGSEDLNVTWPLIGLAELYNAQGKYEQAEPLYQRVLRIREQVWGPDQRDVASCLNRLGFVYAKQGKYEQAESLYQRALRIQEKRLASDPNNAAAYLSRGYVYLCLKKRDSACADFARYASLEPENVNAAWMSVYATLTKQRPGVDVAERLEVIAELDSQCSEAYICRGVALGLRGKPQEGLTELEQALHIDARHEDARFWKGMMCAYLGQSTVARESIEQALQADLPPILLTPLFWLEQGSPHFYQEYAEPLLKRYELA